MKIGIFVLMLLVPFASIRAQQPIEDNSFLIEEAYNQEKGVIQYISSFYRQRDGNWGYNFTNEMPIKSQRHQFSYSINLGRVDGEFRAGDTLINYRYQLLGMKEGSRVAISPRISLILPTGSYRVGTGTGAVGYQFNFPVSVKHTKKIVTHWNAGTTFTPRARNTVGDKANTAGFNLGQSTVFLVRNNFNVLVETSWNKFQNVVAERRTEGSYSLLVNPGVRWAWNFKNGLQIVPGVSVPIGVGPSRGERGIFLYLSFEK